MTFATGFNSYALEADTITCDVDGFTATARIYRDDCGDKPDQRDDGFWPSLNKNSAGYIGDKTQAELRTALAFARRVMTAWQNDGWFYCGVAVTIERNGVQLTRQYNHALWGVECNYPDSDNAYLLEVANDLLDEALDDARAKLAALCSA